MPLNLDAPSSTSLPPSVDGTPSRPVVPGDVTQFTYFRGRVALAAVLRGLGVGAADDVLIQAFTCIAVPEAILSLGARPRYVDVETDSSNMDPEDMKRKLTSRTRAIVIQHSFGLPADVEHLAAAAQEHGVPLIEDCAHTITSRVNGRPVGSFGAAAIYSFEAAKPVFAGIGGSALCNDNGLSAAVSDGYQRYRAPSMAVQLQLATMFAAHRLAYRPSTYWKVRAIYRAVSATGLIRGSYNTVEEGIAPADDFSLRMGRVQSKLVLRGLKRVEAESAHREWVSGLYRKSIRSSGVRHFRIPEGVEPTFGRYPMLVEARNALVEKARRAKVEIAVFYSTPVHPLRGEELRKVGYEPGSCPKAEWVSDRIVSLPTGPQVTQREIQKAVELFNSHGDSSS